MNKRLLTFAITIGISVAASAQQTQTLRDRDPDLSAAKKVAADLQQANFHNGPWYLLSRFRIADAGYSEGAYVPTGDSEGGLSLKVEAPQRLYFVPPAPAGCTQAYRPDLRPGHLRQEGDAQHR